MMTRRKLGTRQAGRTVCLALWAFVVIGGCESRKEFDHVPPSGLGALIVDNHARDDIEVYADGVRLGRVDDWRYSIFDLKPGYYRIVLRGEDGGRAFAGDVDILEGRQTILDVSIDPNDINRYVVLVGFD